MRCTRAAVTLAALLLLLCVWALSRDNRSADAAFGTANDDSFFLIVNLYFKSAADRATFVNLFDEFAAHVAAAERSTLQYRLLFSDAPEPHDEFHCVVLEQYADKAAYVGAHRASAAFATFRAALAALNPRIDGQSFLTRINE